MPRHLRPLTWPAAVPRDFPKPPGAILTAVKQLPPKSVDAKPGVVVSLTVPAGLHEEILYVNRTLLAARFALGRGDAEQVEADIPFTRADVTGQLRLRRATTCRTTWILTSCPADLSWAGRHTARGAAALRAASEPYAPAWPRTSSGFR